MYIKGIMPRPIVTADDVRVTGPQYGWSYPNYEFHMAIPDNHYKRYDNVAIKPPIIPQYAAY